MKISVITLFPEMFHGPFDFSIVKRAQEKGIVDIRIIDLRDFGIGKHKSVDDKPYGGGVGMVLRVDILKNAVGQTLDKKLRKNEQKVVLLSASGKLFKQEKAKEYSKIKHLILICGHYEGVDERILDYIDEEISIGDYVLTGGEIPTMAIIDSVVRLLPGAISKGATQSESFSDNTLEHPQYTRPETFEGKKVPAVLLSGNHKLIDDWKVETGKVKTKKNRKDLL